MSVIVQALYRRIIIKVPAIAVFLITLILFSSCSNIQHETNANAVPNPTFSVVDNTSLVILGTVQDAGSPHIACKRDCCKALFKNPDPLRKVVSLGLIDTQAQQTYLFEAGPDITSQLKVLHTFSGFEQEIPNGIFLTHAHIGHYAGLMYLGKEAVNASEVPVFSMPRMKIFLETNGPWSQLFTNKNIILNEIHAEEEILLSEHLKVTSVKVPHRDEFSETVGYRIEGPSKSVLFIPDIDKWEKWELSIVDAISEVDYAILDATFYDAEEIGYRDISEIPHPFVIESMTLFKALPSTEKNKIHFIHFNHTNPLLDPESEAYKAVIEEGFNIARIHDVISL